MPQRTILVTRAVLTASHVPEFDKAFVELAREPNVHRMPRCPFGIREGGVNTNDGGLFRDDRRRREQTLAAGKGCRRKRCGLHDEFL